MVNTPEFWKNQICAPLIAEKTYYGNEVKIPKSLKKAWESQTELALKQKMSIQELQDFLKSVENPEEFQLMKIFLEVYQD